jgi:hypothetical protein
MQRLIFLLVARDQHPPACSGLGQCGTGLLSGSSAQEQLLRYPTRPRIPADRTRLVAAQRTPITDQGSTVEAIRLTNGTGGTGNDSSCASRIAHLPSGSLYGRQWESR